MQEDTTEVSMPRKHILLQESEYIKKKNMRKTTNKRELGLVYTEIETTEVQGQVLICRAVT